MHFVFETILHPTLDHGPVLKTHLPPDLIESLNETVTNNTSLVQSGNLEDDPAIAALAYELLTKAGFDVYEHRGLLERHSYQPSSEDELVRTPFSIHKDNFGGTDWEVATCIFYTQRDPSIRGGNLELYDEASGLFDWIPSQSRRVSETHRG